MLNWMLDTKLLLSTAYRPQTDGQSEEGPSMFGDVQSMLLQLNGRPGHHWLSFGTILVIIQLEVVLHSKLSMVPLLLLGDGRH
jgi:hypothetical protein